MYDKIYCIDDDPIMLMLTKKVFEKSLFAKEIITFNNSETAFSQFVQLNNDVKNNINSIQPTLVFIDLNMPVLNGWDFLNIYQEKGFHEIFKNTKFIILSSTINPTDIEKAKQYPMVLDFIAKPISKNSLEKFKNEII